MEAFARALPEARVRHCLDGPDACDFALVWRPPPEMFARLRVRRAVVNLGAGVDAVVGLPTLPGDVPLVRVEDAGMAEQMAEYAMHAVLRAYREFDRYAEAQRAARWQRRPRLPKSSFGVGILGLGTLGRAVAQALLSIGFPVAGWSREPRRVEGVASYAGPGGLPALLAGSHVLICLLPSTPATRGILHRETLRALPAGAYVVNVARGDLVVDADLVALLDEGHLSGAMLDVFREEPLPPDHPFWHHARIALTPHVSAVTLVDETVAQVAAKVRALWRGESVSGVVDRARGY
jgi:glyoxylate/hydroxypyruvate reductase A